MEEIYFRFMDDVVKERSLPNIDEYSIATAGSMSRENWPKRI